MARKQTTPTLSPRQELIAALDQSREQVAQDASHLGDILNVSRKLEASFHTYRYWWIGGSILTGLFLAKNLLTPLKSKSAQTSEGENSGNKKSSALLGLLGIAGKQIIRLSKPALQKMIEKEFAQWIANISDHQEEKSERPFD